MAEQLIKQLPPQARINLSDCSPAEKTLLHAMQQLCSSGEDVRPRRVRLADYTGLSTKHIHRLIYGYTDPRDGKRRKGLCERGILTELVKPRRGKNVGKYQINWLALWPAERVQPYLDRDQEHKRQMKLPGIIRSSKSGLPQQPVSDAPNGTPCPMERDTVSVGNGTPCPPDLKASDLKASDLGECAKALVEAVQRTPYEIPATPGNLRAIKEALQAVIAGGKSPPEAFEYLLAVTLEGIERGQLINRFWFEDAKWRKHDRSQFTSVSAAAERLARHLEHSPDAVRGYRTERARDYSRTREN